MHLMVVSPCFALEVFAAYVAGNMSLGELLVHNQRLRILRIYFASGAVALVLLVFVVM